MVTLTFTLTLTGDDTMAFMSAELTEKTKWIECDTGNGTKFIPGELADLKQLSTMLRKDFDSVRDEVYKTLKDYLDIFEAKHLYSVRIFKGYGVRLSASGYMDCTEWEVYTNLQEAKWRARELDRESEGGE